MSILRTALTVDGLESMKLRARQKVAAGTAVLKGSHRLLHNRWRR